MSILGLLGLDSATEKVNKQLGAFEATTTEIKKRISIYNVVGAVGILYLYYKFHKFLKQGQGWG